MLVHIINYHDITVVTIAIMIGITYRDNRLIVTIAQLYFKCIISLNITCLNASSTPNQMHISMESHCGEKSDFCIYIYIYIQKGFLFYISCFKFCHLVCQMITSFSCDFILQVQF